MRLLLIRHGRSTWNAQGRIQGQADPPLDDVGRDQAHKLAERLRGNPPTTLYSSPLQRARETAEIIANGLGVSVAADERLSEYGVGALTGLTSRQVVQQYPEVAERWNNAQSLTIPGEEGRESFRARVVAAFDDIRSQHSEGTSAVISHGGTLGSYLVHLLGLSISFTPFRFDNGSLSIVQPHRVKPRILLLNDTCHLREDL